MSLTPLPDAHAPYADDRDADASIDHEVAPEAAFAVQVYTHLTLNLGFDDQGALVEMHRLRIHPAFVSFGDSHAH